MTAVDVNFVMFFSPFEENNNYGLKKIWFDISCESSADNSHEIPCYNLAY